MSATVPSPRLCLASHSPRRQELLEKLQVPFFIRGARAGVEELIAAENGSDVYSVALRRAEAKARDVVAQLLEESSALPWGVLGVDTVVIEDSKILDKPASALEARTGLKRLADRSHTVQTALYLWTEKGVSAAEERTEVTFAPLEDADIEAYVRSEEPYDKAGGYGIQGGAARFVSRLNGCYFNVVGLPLHRLWVLLREADAPWPGDAALSGS